MEFGVLDWLVQRGRGCYLPFVLYCTSLIYILACLIIAVQIESRTLSLFPSSQITAGHKKQIQVHNQLYHAPLDS